MARGIDTDEERDPLYTEDLGLARRAMDKDPSALADLAERLKCVPRILSYQNVRCGKRFNDHDLADLSQATVLLVLRKLPTYEGRGPLEAWVYRLCCLEFMNELRRHQRLPRPDEEIGRKAEEAGRVGDMVDPFRFEELHRALDGLNEEESAFVELKHFDGLTFLEIGRTLGIPANTAKTRYYRAIGRLRALLGVPDSEGEQP